MKMEQGGNRHSINLGDTKPVKNIRHQSLETHVFDTSDIFRSLEVFACTISTTLSCVVNKVFGNLQAVSIMYLC